MNIEFGELPKKVRRAFPTHVSGMEQNGLWDKTLAIFPQFLLALVEDSTGYFGISRICFQWYLSKRGRVEFRDIARAHFLQIGGAFQFGSLSIEGEKALPRPDTGNHSARDYLYFVFNWEDASNQTHGTSLYGEIMETRLHLYYDSTGKLSRDTSEKNGFVEFAPPLTIDSQEVLDRLFHSTTINNPITASPNLDRSWKSADVLTACAIQLIRHESPHSL